MKDYLPEELVRLKKSEVAVGPLSPHIDSFVALLLKQGYAINTIKSKNRLVVYFSRWMLQKEQRIDSINEQLIDAFLIYRKSQGRHIHRGDQATLKSLFKHLRDIGV